MELAKEEWIVFRVKSQLKVTKFIDDWTEKLSKTPTTALTVRLLQELEQYKVRAMNRIITVSVISSFMPFRQAV